MDEEGKQTMRVLAKNMSFLMKCIVLGREQIGLPETEEHVWIHFIIMQKADISYNFYIVGTILQNVDSGF